MTRIVEYICAYLIGGSAVLVTALLPKNSMASTRSSWYECIRPSLTPPSFVFPIVWSILYITLAIAIAHTILSEDNNYKNIILPLYVVNLILNVIWSFAYFGRRNILLALIILLCLWVCSLSIIILSYKTSDIKWIAILLVPYLIWLSFATILNSLSLKNVKKCKNLS